MIPIEDIDLNNPVFVWPNSPIAEWKRALLVRLGKMFDLKTLIETGTCMGDTVEAVRDHFQDVYSVELSPVFYKVCQEKFAGVPNVHLYFGSSDKELPTMIGLTTGPVLFFLDAHITGGPSASNGDQTVSEMRTIERMCPEALVVIDDIAPAMDDIYMSPDGAPIYVPEGWTGKYVHGELILHPGIYHIPERF